MIFAFILYIQSPDLWEYSGDFRVVNSISCGVRYVYIAGSGFARYDKLFSKWEMPVSRTPFPNNIKLIAQDTYTNEIWFVAGGELGRYNPIFKDYGTFTIENKSSEPCSLGIAKDYIYLRDSLMQGTDVASQKYIQFNKISEQWNTLNSLPQGIDWTPGVSPSDYSYLAPWYVMDKSLMQYRITCVAEDGQWLWVGTEGYGVYKYDNMSHFVSEHYLSGVPGGDVFAMFNDGEAMWFSCSEGIVKKGVPLRRDGSGTSGEGDSYSYFPLERTPNLLSYPGIAIAGNNEKIWVGGQDGISQYDKQDGIWIKFTEADLRDDVRTLYAKGSKLWIGTQRGLLTLEQGMIEKILDNIWVNDITQNASTVWIGTARGVFYTNASAEQTNWQKLTDPYKSLDFGVNKILCDGRDVYFGTEQGLLVYSTNEKKWDRFTYPACLPGEEVLSIAGDKGVLYIGTNNGLAIWEKDKDIWTSYTQTNSPVKGKVHTIIIADKYVYLITESGLVKLKI